MALGKAISRYKKYNKINFSYDGYNDRLYDNKYSGISRINYNNISFKLSQNFNIYVKDNETAEIKFTSIKADSSDPPRTTATSIYLNGEQVAYSSRAGTYEKPTTCSYSLVVDSNINSITARSEKNNSLITTEYNTIYITTE